MSKNDLIKLAKNKKLFITRYWYNTHFRHGARTEEMNEDESYRINAKDFDTFKRLGCIVYKQ